MVQHGAGMNPEQLMVMEVVERTNSCLSLCGSIFIIITYSSSPLFRRPTNRLAFFAAIGNILANIPTLISQAGPRAGSDSALCQFQGFMIQLFVPMDAYWSLAMAFNVYLVFCRGFSAHDLRKFEWAYFASNCIFPLVGALIALLANSESRGKVYGAAGIWCWVRQEWAILRIPMAYGPVVFCYIVTLTIYIRVGILIWRKRHIVKSLANDTISQVDLENPANRRTTHVTITRTATHTSSLPRAENAPDHYGHYSCNIISEARSQRTSTNMGASTNGGINVLIESSRQASSIYFRFAILFSAAALLTWAPPTTYRFLSVINPTIQSYPLNLASSFCLPLIGFWNAIIYITYSKKAIQQLFRSWSIDFAEFKKKKRQGTHVRNSIQMSGFNFQRQAADSTHSII